jgi:hypothetical protein
VVSKNASAIIISVTEITTADVTDLPKDAESLPEEIPL